MIFSFSAATFKKWNFLLLFSLVLLLNLPKVFGAITVDGDLTDWGVHPGTFGNSDWTPDNGAAFIQEDQNGSLSDFLNPGWGGQLFDAEALYFKREGMTAYFALVTGFPFNGVQGYEWQWGDVAFDFGSNGSFEFGFETLGDQGFIKGDLYGDATWYDPYFIISKPYDLKTGNLLGSVNYATSTMVFPQDTHYLLELGIPISLFGNLWSNSLENPEFTVHWTMGCGNDAIDLQLPSREGLPETPEPSSLWLLSIGFGMLALIGKKHFSFRQS